MTKKIEREAEDNFADVLKAGYSAKRETDEGVDRMAAQKDAEVSTI